MEQTVKLVYIKVKGTWVNTLIFKKFEKTEFVFEFSFMGITNEL